MLDLRKQTSKLTRMNLVLARMQVEVNSKRSKILRRVLQRSIAVAAISAAAQAQGGLDITPGRTAATTAGTGAIGYTGVPGAATSATLASPSAVAYDSAGNLYLADTANHVIRELVKSTGTLVTIVGTGTAGFAGDGGPATAALLDLPSGVAVDASGALYIADTHNHRIRKVSNGVISTIAGTGVAGFAGDNAAATSAQLASPQGIAVDAAGAVYIADTANHRVRKIVGSNIITIAGTGEQSYSGDGGAATTATLDSPTSVAVDGTGLVYLADRHNQRVRVINSAGVIATLAGSGTPNFAGASGGDGGPAAASALSRPSGVSIDAAGNIYIADTNNQRIRTVTAGVISTAAGTGEQGFAGDGGTLQTVVLDTPRAVAVDASGNLSISDSGNQRIRGASDASVAFGSAEVGVSSAAQTITLANPGPASLTISSTAITGPFNLIASGTCGAVPLTLAAGASCTEALAFTPLAPGGSTGSIAFAGPGATPQTILLTGTGAQGSSAISIASSAAAPFVNQGVTFTAAVKPAGAGVPTGMVSFYSNNNLIGTAQPLANGAASVTTTFATAGTYAITATYSGDGNFAGASTTALAQLVGDFSFTITADPGQAGSVTAVPGASIAYKLQAAPLNGPFTFPITLSATGLPAGATATFSPSTVTLGGSYAGFTMTVQTAKTSALLRSTSAAPLAAFLLLPFAASLRRRRQSVRPLFVLGSAVLSLGAMLSVTGCGSSSGFFGTQQHTYTINVVGTATNAQGVTLQRVATVQLTLQ